MLSVEVLGTLRIGSKIAVWQLNGLKLTQLYLWENLNPVLRKM